MPHITVNDADIYYELQGEGEPLILISGLRADHQVWLPVLNQLTKHYQVLMFDNRAVGKTKDAGMPITGEMMAADVKALMYALRLHKPHVLGHSLGGAIAQLLARDIPTEIRTLTLCNTATAFHATTKTFFATLLAEYQSGDISPEEALDKVLPWVFSDSFLTFPKKMLMRLNARMNPNLQTTEDFSRQINVLNQFNSSKWVQELAMPTLVIGSEEDKLVPAAETEALAHLIKGARFELLPGGHVSFIEHPRLFVEKLSAFHGGNVCPGD